MGEHGIFYGGSQRNFASAFDEEEIVRAENGAWEALNQRRHSTTHSTHSTKGILELVRVLSSSRKYEIRNNQQYVWQGARRTEQEEVEAQRC